MTLKTGVMMLKIQLYITGINYMVTLYLKHYESILMHELCLVMHCMILGINLSTVI